MRIELQSYGEGALLDLCTILTMNKARHGQSLGPFTVDAIDAVLQGIKGELVRRWEMRAGSPVAIELPQLSNSEQAEVGRMFMVLEELLRGRFRSSDPLPAPFIAESLGLMQTLALAVSPTSELRN